MSDEYDFRNGKRGPVLPAALGKERITIRLSPDVVETFRVTGNGWQTRVDAALRDWLQTHSPAHLAVRDGLIAGRSG